MDTAVEGVSRLGEGLRVRDIATFSLLTCEVTDDPKEVLGREAFKSFDQIPITDQGRIVGIVERLRPDARRPIDDSVLVSADDLLSHFIHTVHEQPYRLVVDKTAIAGIVTWSDLVKVPVLVLAYSVMAELELALNRVIREKYREGDEWLDLLPKADQDKIRSRAKSMVKSNLALPIVELADVVHKAKVLQELKIISANFEAELKDIVRLRNEVAHVKEPVSSDADLKDFVSRFETAERWLAAIGSAATAAVRAGSA